MLRNKLEFASRVEIRFVSSRFYIKLPTSMRSHDLVWLTLFLFVLYLVFAAGRPQNIFWTVDEGGKFVYIQNTMKTGDPSAPLFYFGRSYDPHAEFAPTYFRIQRGDEFYTWWFIGFPLLTLPFYKYLGWMGLFILPAVAGALTATLAGACTRILVPQSRTWPLIAVLVTGLATPVFFYSTMFWEHTLATVCVLTAVYFMLLAQKQNRMAWLYLAGVLGSLGVFFRLEVVALLFGMGLVLLFWRWSAGLRFGAAFVLTTLAWFGVNYLVTGEPLTPALGMVMDNPTLGGVEKMGLRFLPYVLFNPPAIWTLEIPRVLLIIGSICTAIAVITAFLPRLRWLSLIGVGGTVVVSAWTLLNPTGYKSLQGLLISAPVILFAIFLFTSKASLKRSLLPALLLGGGGVFATMYVYKAWIGAGGLQWGPRYLLSTYPLFVIAGVVALHSNWETFGRIMRALSIFVYLAASMTGLGLELRGQVVVNTVKQNYLNTEPAIQALADRPVVTSWCDIVFLIPDLYWTQPMFSTTRPGFDRWVAYARQTGIPEFSYIDIDQCNNIPLDVIKEQGLSDPSGITIQTIRPMEYPIQ